MAESMGRMTKSVRNLKDGIQISINEKKNQKSLKLDN